MGRRSVLLIAGACAVVIVAAVAFTLGPGGEDDNASVDAALLAIDPLLVEHTTVDRLTCPSGRADSPLADADHEQGVADAREGYAEGQLAPFSLLLEADADAVGPLDVSFDAIVSPALGGQIACAFVDPTDPKAVEQPDGEPASASLDRAGLVVVGVEAGETVAVELWATIVADEADNNEAAASVELAPRLASVAERAAMAFDTEFGRSTLADENPTIGLDASANLVELGQTVTATVSIENPSEVDALSRATLTGSVGDNASVGAVEVRDGTASVTECTAGGGTYACDLGFLAPGETVELTIELTASSTALPDGPRVAGGVCGRRQPRICHEVELSYLDAFSQSRESAEYEIRITSAGPFTVQLTQDPERTVRVGDTVEFELSVSVNSESDSADSLDVSLSSCQGLTRARGDDGDNQMEPGEVWVYQCRAEALAETLAIVFIRGELGDREPIESSYPIELDAYDARMELRLARVVEGTSWDLENTGSADLTSVALDPFGGSTCEPVYLSGDANEDSVLQPGEIWEYSCPDPDANAVAVGVDPAGRPVDARAETATGDEAGSN